MEIKDVNITGDYQEEKAKCELCDKKFKSTEGLMAHNKAKHPELVPKERKSLPVKKIRNWGIFIIICGLIIWGIIALILNIRSGIVVDESELNFDAPKIAIHWHRKLTINIDGKNIIIPSDLGLSGAHLPIHTHEDANIGILHMENNRPTRKTVTLGYFFEVWGKKLSKDCIFEHCTDKGLLKMYVNGMENFDFEKYFMQDQDEILIEYTSTD